MFANRAVLSSGGRPSGTITFLESDSNASTSGTFGGALASGDICVVLACNGAFPCPLPDAPDGTWTTIASTFDNTYGSTRLAYKVMTGSTSDTGTWANADKVMWWNARNARGTWVIGTYALYYALDTACTYPSVTPDGVSDWVVYMGQTGGFDFGTLSAGSPTPTQREHDPSGNSYVISYDTNGICTSSPGSTSSPGYTNWEIYGFPIKAGS